MFLPASDSRIRIRHSALLVLPLMITGLALLLVLGTPTATKAQEVARIDLSDIPGEKKAPAAGNALGIASSVWRTNFGEQSGLLLRTGSDAVREQSLRNVIVVANLDRNGIDLSEAVPELVEVVKVSHSSERRLMALQALNNIGTDHAKTSVYRHAMEEIRTVFKSDRPLEESNRVHRAAASMLYKFYSNNGED